MSDSKIALITGGSRGIGRSTVLALAKKGVSSILTYNSNKAEADKVVALVKEAGANAVALQLDIGQSSTFAAFAEAVTGALKTLKGERFDYLVNNAGTSSGSSLANITEDEMDALYAVHFKGPLFLTQKLVALMNDGGRIVNISSGLARFSMPGRIGYGSIKAGVEALTRYMAVDLSARRISVNTVAPGAIATDFSGGFIRDNPDVQKHLAAMTALGRIGLPDDIGNVIANLLSDEMGWINAQRIEVSGGVHI